MANKPLMADAEPAMISEAELQMLGSVPLKKDVTKNLLKKGEWRLDGIVFKDQRDWTVWLNGEQFTPTHLPTGIRIVEVCDESVQLCLDEEGAPVKTLCLNYCVKLHA
jgi:hypothetical protein